MRLSKALKKGLGRRGIAAVEFALIMPILLVLFIGTIEVLTLYRTEAKLNAVAINVAQMVAITQSVSLATSSNNGVLPTVTSLNDICQGAIQGLAPFPSAGLTVHVASVTLEPSAANSNTAATTPAYDEWEADSAQTTGVTCSTSAGTSILSGTGATAPITIATKSTSPSILAEPCDNVIIVQTSLPYPGLTGLIIQSRPTLTQTAYTRWSNASTQTQLLCTGALQCTLKPPVPLDRCNATNTATN